MADRADSFIAAAADPQLAALAADPRPAVLFDRGGTRILWANGAGAAYLGVSDPAALARRGFAAESAPARRIATLARQLSGTEERTERLALPKGLLPQPVVCRARRVALGIERHVLLVVGDGTGRLDPATAARRYEALTAAARLAAAPAVTELSADIAGVAVPEDAPAVPAVPAPAPREAVADAAGETIPEDAPDEGETAPGTAADATPELAAREAAVEPAEVATASTASDVADAVPVPAERAESAPGAVATKAAASAPAAIAVAAPSASEVPAAASVSDPADATVDAAFTEPVADADADADGMSTVAAESDIAAGIGERPDPTVSNPTASLPEADAAIEPTPAEAVVTTGDDADAETDTGAPIEAASESDAAVEAPVTDDAAPATPAEPTFKAPTHGRAVRFVFELDDALAFRFVSDDLAATVGPRAADLAGRRWPDVARDFGLDPLGRVATALGRRDTFTGLTVDWPVQDAAARVPVDLAGMPVFGRDRAFKGYRGFGIAKCGALFAAPVAVTAVLATAALATAAATTADTSTDDAPTANGTDLPAAEAPALVEEPAVETVDTPVVPQIADVPTDLGAGSDEAAAEEADDAASPPCEPSDLPAAEAPALVEDSETVEIVHAPGDAPGVDVPPEEVVDDLGGAAFRDDADTPDAPPPPAPPTPPAEQPSPPRPDEAPAGPSTPSVEPAAPEVPPAPPPEAPAPAPSAPDTAPGAPEEVPADLPEEVPAGVPDEAPLERPDEVAPPVVEETGAPLPDEMPAPVMPSEFAAPSRVDAEAPTPDETVAPMAPAAFAAQDHLGTAPAGSATETGPEAGADDMPVPMGAAREVGEIPAPALAAIGVESPLAGIGTRTADATAVATAPTSTAEPQTIADPGETTKADNSEGAPSDTPSGSTAAEIVAVEAVPAPNADEAVAETAERVADAVETVGEAPALADHADLSTTAELPAAGTATDSVEALAGETGGTEAEADVDEPAAPGVDAIEIADAHTSGPAVVEAKPEQVNELAAAAVPLAPEEAVADARSDEAPVTIGADVPAATEAPAEVAAEVAEIASAPPVQPAIAEMIPAAVADAAPTALLGDAPAEAPTLVEATATPDDAATDSPSEPAAEPVIAALSTDAIDEADAPATDEPDDDAPVVDGVEADVAWSERTTAEVIPSPIVPRAVPKPFYSDAEAERRQLSRPEREAFQKIAEALGARLEGGGPLAPAGALPEDAEASAAAVPTVPVPPAPAGVDCALLDRLPIAIALLKDGEALFVNRAFLALTGYDSAAALADAGGISAAFAGSALPRDASLPALRRRDGVEIAVAARLHSVPVDGGAASMLVIQETAAATGATRAASAEARAEELEAILDTATDGVLVLDPKGVVVGANRSAEALFGTERSAMVGEPLVSLLAPESHRAAIDYLDGLSRNGLSSVLNDGREVIGRVRGGGLVPLFMTVGRVSATRFCAVLRDITQWKRAEEELTNAKRAAETASSQKSEFLAKISHEIRTPLNAIIGFSEVMMEERFGPVGSERYKEYLRDIHLSGAHIMSLVNDLLDLSKIEAGKLDLSFEAVAPNDVIRECVALMQPQANRERIIIRTSLSSSLPAVVADSRSLRQIVLNLLSNAIKFNTPGGQVIVSTLYEVTGEVALRVRDTGPGMSEDDIAKALEPFRQLQTTRPGRGTGLGLPLTKALVEANRASFRIDSTVGQGTLVQVTFPSTRVLAE
ncbi:ATP-binding protein [Oharaeibacter diazotrophicus]|uniref:histidine kinase n=1 Tax=Oharaeibacter diazotrophicus TaxID=1920512 RepID=A0A4R6RGI4_9HYPH|nr:ATP-binding protein [Oharaeibacter diazotrophicus]TDP85354.1 PAS domain S-box-containing protein [Oharaeibacter diazotrophicus]BBE74324.1 cell-division control histidine kinase PdhS [Pleomorphomonas sp. SM30]